MSASAAWEIQGRYRGDIGEIYGERASAAWEIRGRYGGDIGEIQGRYTVSASAAWARRARPCCSSSTWLGLGVRARGSGVQVRG